MWVSWTYIDLCHCRKHLNRSWGLQPVNLFSWYLYMCLDVSRFNNVYEKNEDQLQQSLSNNFQVKSISFSLSYTFQPSSSKSTDCTVSKSTSSPSLVSFFLRHLCDLPDTSSCRAATTHSDIFGAPMWNYDGGHPGWLCLLNIHFRSLVLLWKVTSPNLWIWQSVVLNPLKKKSRTMCADIIVVKTWLHYAGRRLLEDLYCWRHTSFFNRAVVSTRLRGQCPSKKFPRSCLQQLPMNEPCSGNYRSVPSSWPT